jgi:hypothetical protein
LSDNHKDSKLVLIQTKTAGLIVKIYSQQIIDPGIKVEGKEIKFNDFECYDKITLF